MTVSYAPTAQKHSWPALAEVRYAGRPEDTLKQVLADLDALEAETVVVRPVEVRELQLVDWKFACGLEPTLSALRDLAAIFSRPLAPLLYDFQRAGDSHALLDAYHAALRVWGPDKLRFIGLIGNTRTGIVEAVRSKARKPRRPLARQLRDRIAAAGTAGGLAAEFFADLTSESRLHGRRDGRSLALSRPVNRSLPLIGPSAITPDWRACYFDEAD